MGILTVVGSSPSSSMVQNYKQMSGDCSPTNTEELLTPAHEENVRFIHYSKLLQKYFQKAEIKKKKKKVSGPSKIFCLYVVWEFEFYITSTLLPTAWQRVMREMQTCQGSENNNQGPQKYVERMPNPALSCMFNWVIFVLGIVFY